MRLEEKGVGRLGAKHWCSGHLVARAALAPGCARGPEVRVGLSDLTWASVRATPLLADQGLGVAGVPVQQQPERHPGRRDGPGKDHPDHRAHHVPHGAQAHQWALPHHRTSLVSAPAPGGLGAADAGTLLPGFSGTPGFIQTPVCQFIQASLTRYHSLVA